MNHLFIEADLPTKIIRKIIRFLDIENVIEEYDLDMIRNPLKVKERCFNISGNISRRYGSRDYLTNCVYTKIDDKEAIQITIPVSRETWNKIVLYITKKWKIEIHAEEDKIFGQILAYLTFEENLGKEKIKLDHKESTVGIGLATISMLVSNNISESNILQDMGQDIYYN